MDEVLGVTLNSPPPKEWRYLKKRQAAIAMRKRELKVSWTTSAPLDNPFHQLRELPRVPGMLFASDASDYMPGTLMASLLANRLKIEFGATMLALMNCALCLGKSLKTLLAIEQPTYSDDDVAATIRRC